VTPRIYANELAGSAPDYLPHLLSTLDEQQLVLYCGSDIVARHADAHAIADVAPASAHPLILWDNLYANDYCPQRLFVGPWIGRDPTAQVLLNPTGMPYTDTLLLDMMTSYRLSFVNPETIWNEVLTRHGVPPAFAYINRYFCHPVFNGEPFVPPEPATAETFEVIEECLWRWKSPLSREWYPFLFGLKLDLLVARGSMSTQRIWKTQSAPRAMQLTSD
jgi:hypothetical protein